MKPYDRYHRTQPIVRAMDESETASMVKAKEPTAYVVIQGVKRLVVRKRDRRDPSGIVSWVAISSIQATSEAAWREALEKLEAA